MDRDTQRSHVSMGMQTGVMEGSTSQGTPRITSKPPAAGRGTEGQPCDTLMLNFWPPELGGNTFLLSEAILRVVIRYPGPRSTYAQELGTDPGAELREAHGARDTDSLPRSGGSLQNATPELTPARIPRQIPPHSGSRAARLHLLEESSIQARQPNTASVRQARQRDGQGRGARRRSPTSCTDGVA